MELLYEGPHDDACAVGMTCFVLFVFVPLNKSDLVQESLSRWAGWPATIKLHFSGTV